ELEQLARSQDPEERPHLSLDIKVERGAAPDAGFAASVPSSSPAQSGGSTLIDVLSRTEEPLTLEEKLSITALRLRHHVLFGPIAVFALRGTALPSRFALGESMGKLASLCIPMGEGLAGWVAETGNYSLNGNPTVEPGWEGSRRRSMRLLSALAVPISH